ncbi:MAG: class I SAM-dependent methyltransferase [Actinomycetota bacterium]|nr:class I SAM-dependent methyltransferase [Actinomycetota bacterium]
MTAEEIEGRWDPDSYLEAIHAEVPRYDELQEAAIAAIPFEPARILELGFGTAETTQRLLDRFPQARITGLDSSPEMVFKARELGWEDLRLGRIEDPLPDGPWDLVIAVLSIHHLDARGKRDLFRRVREHSRSLVIADVVEVEPERRVTPIEAGFDKPSPAAEQAEWCGGEVIWEADDLAVIRATY